MSLARHVAGVWVNGRLVADKYHRPLDRIIDPDTGNHVLLTQEGRIYATEPAESKPASSIDIARMNKCLADAMAHPMAKPEVISSLTLSDTPWLIVIAITVFNFFATTFLYLWAAS